MKDWRIFLNLTGKQFKQLSLIISVLRPQIQGYTIKGILKSYLGVVSQNYIFYFDPTHIYCLLAYSTVSEIIETNKLIISNTMKVIINQLNYKN